MVVLMWLNHCCILNAAKCSLYLFNISWLCPIILGLSSLYSFISFTFTASPIQWEHFIFVAKWAFHSTSMLAFSACARFCLGVILCYIVLLYKTISIFICRKIEELNCYKEANVYGRGQRIWQRQTYITEANVWQKQTYMTEANVYDRGKRT